MIRESQATEEVESQDTGERRHPSLTDDLKHLASDLAKVFSGSLELVALEGRLAAVSLTWLLALGVIAAVLLISVWALIMTALGIWLSSKGFDVVLTLLCIALMNVILSLLLWLMVRRISRNLTFQASRQQIFAPDKTKVNDAE